MSNLLQVRDLRKRFGGVLAVADLSFDLRQGEVLGIIGPNGAGKTTAINLVGGSIKPDSGSVVLAGRDVTGLAPHRLVRLGLSRTFQSTTVFNGYTVAENCWCGAFLQYYKGFLPSLLGTHGVRRRRMETAKWIDEVLSWLRLAELRHVVADQLPYGHQKTLGIAIAIAARPSVIMLDEPVAGLGAEEADRIHSTIAHVRDQGISVIVIDHNMRFMSNLCDRIVVMHHGQELAQGTPDEVMSNEAVIAAYLGSDYAAAGSQ